VGSRQLAAGKAAAILLIETELMKRQKQLRPGMLMILRSLYLNQSFRFDTASLIGVKII
jgi:hypothetical protein